MFSWCERGIILNFRHLPSSENQAQDEKNVRQSQKRSAKNVREKSTISTFTQGLTTYNLERLVQGLDVYLTMNVLVF